MAFNIRLQNFLGILPLLIILCPYQAIAYDLIHRDSPLSPFYDPSSTHYNRLQNAFERSLSRANHLKLGVQSPMHPGGGEYLLKMSIGTPPKKIVGIIDSGSHLTWTQCLPCDHCYNQTIPLFDPTNSSSYQTIHCDSTYCQALRNPLCDEKTSACGYDFSYGDGSQTSGSLASETLTIGNIGTKSLSIVNFTFGCAHNSEGTFDDSGSGIIGLSTSELSLVSQLGPNFGQQFSYCLVPNSINSTSRISFGNESKIFGPGVVTTPFQKNSHDSFYHLTLEAISVGRKRIKFATSPSEGNIIIDSGTTLTLLPYYVFNELELALDKEIKLEKVVDHDGPLNLCYKSKFGDEKLNLPRVTLHFKGANVALKSVNTFSWVKDDVLCFTMIPNDDLVIYGNLAQTNFEIGYDLQASTVSFKPMDCARENNL